MAETVTSDSSNAQSPIARGLELVMQDVEKLKLIVAGLPQGDMRGPMMKLEKAVADCESNSKALYSGAVKAMDAMREEIAEHKAKTEAEFILLRDTVRATGQQNANLKKQLREATAKGEK